MTYCIRPMLKKDILQVKEIDREAFPTMIPPPNFERELQNKMTHYFVVCDESRSVKTAGNGDESKKQGLLNRIRSLFPGNSSNDAAVEREVPFVCGYVGFWVLAEEAHITTIAVKEECQRKGIGELLMMTVFDRAKKLYASVVTLEVRVSNTNAQHLYLKYGLREEGLRKHYYTDNREDAYIMTSSDITTKESAKQLDKLQREHAGRWGKARFDFS